MTNKGQKMQRIMFYISVVLLIGIVSWLLFQASAYAINSQQKELPSDRCEEFEELARRAINGEPYDCFDEVIFQSQCRQGEGIYKACDCYLDGKYYSTTYFCAWYYGIDHIR